MTPTAMLAVQPRVFVITTDSDHELDVYLNLAGRMKLTGINQLWVADITYIRLKAEFVYVAVILDAFSRKVVGWELDRTLATRLPMAALEYAIKERQPPPGLVHHSDLGVQYASGDYVKILRKQQAIPSMSRPANPYDNASCESFMKTLKREEIHANEYRDLDDLRANIQAFIEQYYNRLRLHSALGYRPPEEFEQAASSETTSQGAGMSFFRHPEIFRSDVRFLIEGKPTEAGWSPPEPTSASPAQDDFEGLGITAHLTTTMPRQGADFKADYTLRIYGTLHLASHVSERRRSSCAFCGRKCSLRRRRQPRRWPRLYRRLPRRQCPRRPPRYLPR